MVVTLALLLMLQGAPAAPAGQPAQPGTISGELRTPDGSPAAGVRVSALPAPLSRSPMVEPTIVCPSCKSEVKLTESLAAPLIDSIRQQYEQRLAREQAEISKREAAVKQQQDAIAKARASIDEQVAAKKPEETAGTQ